MADRIKLLPDIVANQIAAGEVVNRPSCVVKEMMENAIDAGARTVTVNFREGGRELIQIVDDGCGLSPLDARMAFDRHATSKISSVEDIYALHTFGFRGEALASIAAVSQVELRTRQEQDEVGTLTTVNGGHFEGQQPTMCPVGAQFCVRNLFYNVPARRRFLDKSSTSASQIRSEFQRVALCNPQVAFRLLNNDAPVYNLPPANLRGRIVDVIGKYIKGNLLEVSAATSIVRIEGFVGRPAAAKKTGAEQYLFVNGRYFRSPYFYKAVVKAYEKLIPQGTQPAYFLYLTIDPERIDVNVHPQKTEVKFADAEAVWQIINAAVRETLAKTGAVPLMDFDEAAPIDIPVLRKGAVYSEPSASSGRDYNPFRDEYAGSRLGRRSQADLSDLATPYHTPAPGPEEQAFELPSAIAGEESGLEFIPSQQGEQTRLKAFDERACFTDPIPLAGGHAAALYGGRLVVIDLGRAHERIAYENYLLMIGNGSSVSQQLLFPEKLVLSHDEYELMRQHGEAFARLGFDFGFEQECTVEVRGIPADMAPDTADEVIFALLGAFADGEPTGDEMGRRRIAELLSRGTPRTSHTPSRPEIEALLASLCQTGNISFAPSGKPILFELSADEIRNRLE